MSRIFEALQQSSGKFDFSTLSSSRSASNAPEPLRRRADENLPLDGVPAFALSTSPERRLVAAADRPNLAAEKLRMLAARLKYVQQRQSVKKLLITSTVQHEGKSLVAANLAVALAAQRQRTLLIDGDLHRPGLDVLLGAGSRQGLADWWQQRENIVHFLCRAERISLWLLPAGRLKEQALAMLQSAEISQLVAQLSGWFDWIVIDSPPLAPLADTAAWMSIADAALLVTRHAVTPKKLLRRCIEGVEKSKILGIVLNDTETNEERFYRGYYQKSFKQSSIPKAAEEIADKI